MKPERSLNGLEVSDQSATIYHFPNAKSGQTKEDFARSSVLESLWRMRDELDDDFLVRVKSAIRREAIRGRASSSEMIKNCSAEI